MNTNTKTSTLASSVCRFISTFTTRRWCISWRHGR